jgi:arylsulfatase A-like enzyme
MKRRDFLKTGAACVAAPYVLTPRRSEKPNLLFIWTDEQRADTMAAYGNHWIQTPNLNRLAGESLVLANGYISQPVCTPSRATVMTGLWPHQHSCTRNNMALPETTACLPELVHDADYRTGYMGKWHLGDELFSQHGFEEWVSIEDGYRKYYGPQRDKSKRSDYWQFLHDLGYTADEGQGYYSRSFASRLPIEHAKPKFLENNAIRFLQKHRHEPFMLYVNFLEPHMPYNGPLNDLYDPAALPLPKNFLDPLEDNEPLRYRLLRQNYITKGFGGIDLTDEKGWRRIMANYYGLVTQVDRSVGAILAELERLGLADNTIVVYTSDHGDMMASHHMLAKTVMYEESVRIPWLMRVPRLGRKQRMIKGHYSHIDMVPTLLDLLSQEKADLPGRSLMPMVQNNRTDPEPVFIQWNGAEGEVPVTAGDHMEEAKKVHDSAIRTVITQDGWKLCLSERDRHQLFNLEKDPYETTNIYDQKKQSKKIEQLKKLIRQWQEKVQDPVRLAEI